MSVSIEAMLALVGVVALSISQSPAPIPARNQGVSLVREELGPAGHSLVVRTHRLTSDSSSPRRAEVDLRGHGRVIAHNVGALHPLGHALHERWAHLDDDPRRVTVWFAFDSAHVRDRAHDRLVNFARALPKGSHVTVAGHADHVGSNEYNERLSRQRADVVTRLLAGERLTPTTRAYGERCPYLDVLDGQNEPRWWDRRVMVTVGPPHRTDDGRLRPCPT